jgi:hypothetical protein
VGRLVWTVPSQSFRQRNKCLVLSIQYMPSVNTDLSPFRRVRCTQFAASSATTVCSATCHRRYTSTRQHRC